MEIKLVPISNNDMIRYLLNLIRYDIPVLMSGKSSIGKSFTILKLAEGWGMPNAVLYVGSEKADNIEGLPKLIDEKSEQKENVLTYYKPYWYPKSKLIQASVQRGYEIFVNKIKPNFADPSFNNLPYKVVMGLLFSIRKMKFPANSNTGLFSFIDDSRFVVDEDKNIICNKEIQLERQIVPLGEEPLEYSNDLYDLSLFLCTLSGLGNYWLVLDELDKVQPEEADKFAPMLHIVRERRLKTYNMREINNGQGTDVAMNVVNNSYVPIFNLIEDSLKNNKSILDTRIIAISNKTNNIIEISDALFKRFVQVIIGDVLVLDKVDTKLSEIRECLSKIETKIGGQQGDLEVGKLQEINLQWQFGFLPKILNNKDTDGNFIRKNYLENILPALSISDDIAKKQKINNLAQKTVLYKLCLDNFDDEIEIDEEDTEITLPNLVMGCLETQFMNINTSEKELAFNPLEVIRLKQEEGFTNDKDIALSVYDFLIDKYNLIPNDNKYLEMENVIRMAFDFIRYTAYPDGFTEDKISKGQEYNPLAINEYLIPIIIKFILKIITKDTMISFDDKNKLMALHSKLWEDFSIPEHIQTLRGNPELTKELFYGGTDSLWGSKDINADDFQNSFVNAYNSSNMELFEEFLFAYMDMTDTERSQYVDFINYIKKYRAGDVDAIRKRKGEALRNAKKSAEAISFDRKFKQFFV